MSWTDGELYARALATLLACWGEIARGTADATVQRQTGVSAAVFPSGPEREVYNNAVLDRGLGSSDRRRALDAMELAYASAGIEQFAAWVHESDETMSQELCERGYSISESTRVMSRSLDEFSEALSSIDLAVSDLREHVRVIGVPQLLRDVDPSAFRVLVARVASEPVATAMAFDHAGDCGVFNVGTLESARRQGVATAVTNRLLRDAAARGCVTASLQATEIAEGVYTAAGFRDLGRILEYVPPSAHTL